MREKLCLALALTHTNEALFPGRFRSRESGLLHHWRLNAPPKPPIFIPRDGVLDDRIELDDTTRGNYDTLGKSKLLFQENYVMWTLGDDDDVGTMLTSGLTRVKKDRDYCVKLDLIPLAPDLTLTVNLHGVDDATLTVQQPFNMTVETSDICSNGATCVSIQESPKKRRLRPPSHNTIELPPYRATHQQLQLQLKSNANVGLRIEVKECTSQAWLRALKTTTSTTTPTTTSTTTTEGPFVTTASFLDLLEDFTVNRNDSQVTTEFPFEGEGVGIELPNDWNINREIDFYTPPMPSNIVSTQALNVIHEIEQLVDEVERVGVDRGPRLKIANANSSSSSSLSSLSASLFGAILISFLHI